MDPGNPLKRKLSTNSLDESTESSEIRIFPFLFSELPLHNQLDVVKKLNFKDSVRFKKSSKDSLEIAKNLRPTLEVKRITFNNNIFTMDPYSLESALKERVRMEIEQFRIYTPISNENFGILEDFCRKMKFVANEVCVYGENGRTEQVYIGELVKLLSPESLFVSSYAPKDIFYLPDLQQVETFRFSKGIVKEADLLRLKLPRFHLLSLTEDLPSSTINSFFKQWLDGERRVDLFYLDKCPLDTTEMFSGLEISALWSANESSVLRNMHELNMNMKLKKIYSLKREDGRNLFIAFIKEEEKDFDYIADAYPAESSQKVIAGEYGHPEEISKWFKRNPNFL